eukprot:scaffold299628_cov24-Tisochrysis_lutea.AAC.1
MSPFRAPVRAYALRDSFLFLKRKRASSFRQNFASALCAVLQRSALAPKLRSKLSVPSVHPNVHFAKLWPGPSAKWPSARASRASNSVQWLRLTDAFTLY